MVHTIGNIAISPTDTIFNSTMLAPFSITPSNLMLGMNQLNSSTPIGAGPLTSAIRTTPKGIFTSKVKEGKLLTPVAYSPMNNR